MKKIFLILFIVVDLAVIAASVAFLVTHMRAVPTPAVSKAVSPISGKATAVVATSTSAAVVPAPAANTPAAPAPTERKILFSYKNSKARKVMIRAEFTGWRGEPMQKDPAKGAWTYMATLEPGEYAYCYSITDAAGNDKSIRDPANNRTKQVGKTVVSAIVVQPLPAPSPK